MLHPPMRSRAGVRPNASSVRVSRAWVVLTRVERGERIIGIIIVFGVCVGLLVNSSTGRAQKV